MYGYYLGFAGVAAAMILVPGVDFAVVTRNALDGRSRGVVTGLGVAVGLCLHTTIAAAGVAAIVAASPLVLRAMQYAGAAYLLYLGVRAFMAAYRTHQRRPTDNGPMVPETPARGGLWRAGVQGFLANALNPKAPLLFLSLMPQFVPPGNDPTLALITLSLIAVALGLLWFPTVALVANRFSEVMKAPSRRSMIDTVTGTILVGFALVIALP